MPCCPGGCMPQPSPPPPSDLPYMHKQATCWGLCVYRVTLCAWMSCHVVSRLQAAASADGHIRVYEATEVTNLQSWPLLVRCPMQTPLLCSGVALAVWLPSMSLYLSHPPVSLEQDCFLADESGATCVSWNQSTFDTPTMVVGCANAVVIFAMDPRTKKWEVWLWLCCLVTPTFVTPFVAVPGSPIMSQAR